MTGSLDISFFGFVFQIPVTGGTTDGNTFSLTGHDGEICGGNFTLSGDCGTDARVFYQVPEVGGLGVEGVYRMNVECTLL